MTVVNAMSTTGCRSRPASHCIRRRRRKAVARAVIDSGAERHRAFLGFILDQPASRRRSTPADGNKSKPVEFERSRIVHSLLPNQSRN
uniref:Uncharacterized protein n=1 Tax=Angiostrongylus cantonensis TaxID=6313 RepID=A0A0K0DF16_ANGCA